LLDELIYVGGVEVVLHCLEGVDVEVEGFYELY